MIGGGKWDAQNKKLSGVYINFVNKSTKSSENSDPVPVTSMYLYGHATTDGETPAHIINGVGYVGAVLAELPEWDKETYPYAYIGHYYAPMLAMHSYSLYVTPKPLVFIDGGPKLTEAMTILSAGAVKSTSTWDLKEHFRETTHAPYQDMVWSNYDIADEDGTIHLAASDPIPVSDPVAYLYNGVRLPTLPEWDRETYPYAVISHFFGTHLFVFPKDADYFYTDSGYSCFGFEEFVEGEVGLSWSLTETEDGLQWSFTTHSANILLDDSVQWSNFDLYTDNTLNTLLIAASEPIPVYE